MPRSNRPSRARRRGHSERPVADDEDTDWSGLLDNWRRTETRRGTEWIVQPISTSRAVKQYVCPGCQRVIQPGTAHLVAWRAGGVLGDEADIAARRHWHTHCWRIG